MTLYDYTIGNYIKNLQNMHTLLGKVELWAQEKNVKEEDILRARLSIDQFTFVKQVQSMSDSAKSSGAVLAHIEVPSMPDTESTIAELKQRMEKTIDFLKTIKPESINEKELASRIIPLKWFPGKGINAYDHSSVYCLPNFFFHYTTAYSILRHIGLPIGKADFMGGLPFVDVQA